ncbi:MAG: sodium:solute symporter [Flavobacteriales bacterium]
MDNMAFWMLLAIGLYFLVLIAISFLTSKKDDSNKAFFLGNKQSPWYVVSFGMIGASLSGVTFVSVPGWVESNGFSYLQMCMGYLAGYLVISFVLLPLYYRLNLTSIYSYLGQRFGQSAHLTGSFFFLISRLIGASFRLYLVANIFQMYIADYFGISFFTTVLITILLIWLYTFRSGIKTIIWTDTLQTFFMLAAVCISIIYLLKAMDLSILEANKELSSVELNTVFFFDDWKDSNHFVKQFISGMFITIAMTGLDQDMMQKNLSCKNLKESKLNMISFGFVLLLVNAIFLFFGGLLFLYAQQTNLADVACNDALFPEIALSGSLSTFVMISFILGLVASAYSSADSALTSLTTIFYVDFWSIFKPKTHNSSHRKWIHVGFSILLLIIIMNYKWIANDNLIVNLFKAASYTYGPLLALFFFGLWTKRKLRQRAVFWVCILAPVLCYALSVWMLNAYQFDFGFTLLPLNGCIGFLCLWMISYSEDLVE